MQIPSISQGFSASLKEERTNEKGARGIQEELARYRRYQPLES